MTDTMTFDPDALRKEFADYCADVEPGIKAKAPQLNQLETLALIGMALFQAAKELKAEKAQQAARIAELEAQIATVAPAVDAQPVAWMTKGDWRPWLTTTHPEVAESWRRDKREVFPLYASAQSEGLRKDAVRREAFFEAALRASIHSQYPVTTEYDRGYAKAREDAAAAIRALSQKTAEGEKK